MSSSHPSVRVTDVRIPMRDGVHLAADVAAADDGTRHPILLMRTPYSRTSLREYYDPVALARAGWAVVLQDVRGRLDSDGEFRPFEQEVADGYDTLDWCASQPWSNGQVAMAGASYNGMAQWLAALSGHPALAAISPVLIGSSLRDHFTRQGGVFEQGFLSGWAVAMAASGNDPVLAVEAAATLPSWPALLREDPSPVDRLLPAYSGWRAGDDSWFDPLEVDLGAIDVPAFQVAGWYDVFCEGQLAAHSARAARGVVEQLVVGPWAHVNLFQQLVGEVDFGPEALGVARGVPAQMLEFLRAAVDGREPSAAVTVFVMGANTWRTLPSWPPPSQARVLPLHEKGWSGLTWRHDPTDPVPSHGGRTLLAPLPPAGPIDQRSVHAREDVITWTSDELTDDITILGTVTAEVALASTSDRTDVHVTLCDVQPDGRVLNVVDGVVRSEGASGTVTIPVGSTAQVLRAGHRIRLAVCSSSWPRFETLPAAALTLDPQSSSLTLPVVESS